MLDKFDISILNALQTDLGFSRRELSERVGLSPNACWNRVQNLRRRGVVTGQHTRLDRARRRPAGS